MYASRKRKRKEDNQKNRLKILKTKKFKGRSAGADRKQIKKSTD